MSDTTIQDIQDKIIAHIEKEFAIRSVAIQIPPQGMTSSVFFIKASDGGEYAVKYGRDAMKDVPALELIAKKHVAVPVPKLFGSFRLEELPIVAMERMRFPLLESVLVEEMPKYIPSMIMNLKKLHAVTSATPGLLSEPENKKTWKEMMFAIFDGGEFDWEEVSRRDGLDHDLIMASVLRMREKISRTLFEDDEYSFLHTDFNQRNLFVDPDSDRITGIIDWEEAMFGDPMYDFARVRMYLWHFDLGERAIKDYYDLLDFTPKQKELEDLYWLSRVIQYLGWYSEELNEFNKGRIKLHQDYLRIYHW